MTSHDDEIDILHADRHRDKSLVTRLAVAEEELASLSARSREAWQVYAEIGHQVTAQADLVKDLRRQVRDATAGTQLSQEQARMAMTGPDEYRYIPPAARQPEAGRLAGRLADVEAALGILTRESVAALQRYSEIEQQVVLRTEEAEDLRRRISDLTGEDQEQPGRPT